MTEPELESTCSDLAALLITATILGGILSWFGMLLWTMFCLTHHCGR